MKKKNIALLALSSLMAASLSVGILAACKPADEVKPSALVDGVNCYYGDGEDVHLGGWITSVTNDAWTVEENYTDETVEGAPVVTHLGYSKNDAWRNFGVKIDGDYSDFSYLNITMRAKTRGTNSAVSVFLKIVNPITGRDDMNVLGSDLYFDVSTDVYTTYTFEIPSKYRQILDVVEDVCLFPEPGIANTDTIHAGDIYVKDMWFSKESPEDGVTPVDDTWRTEAWCGYDVTRGGNNEAVISYNKPADWSRFYRPVPRDEIFLEDGTVNNMLKLQFTSDTVKYGETEYVDSVEQFQFGIWGDADPTSDAQYYQQWFGQYYRDKYEDTGTWSNNNTTLKVEKDEETGVITLYCQVAPLLMAMEGHYDQQIWIVFNLESQPQGGGSDQAPGYIHGPVSFDGIGQMTILSSEFYFDKNEPVYSEPVVNESGWESSVAGAYVISSEKSDVVANVTYTDLAADRWCCVAYGIDSSRGNTVTITLRNNGTEQVLYGIDWNDQASRQYAYLASGGTANIKLQNASGTGPINLFLDSCYPGYDSSVTDAHSGDVDIVSMEFSDETITPPDPGTSDVNGWSVVSGGAGYYTISDKADVLANISYEDVPKTLWANLYREVSASECTDTVKITLRNNGAEKVLYGIELGAESSRQYGWLEAEETKTITLTNSEAYTVINFFLDCCYDDNYTTDKQTLSGDVDIVSLEFVGGSPATECTPIELTWSTKAANLSLEGNVITLNNLTDGAWQNVSADLTLTQGGKLSLPITNNTNAIAKFKLSVMYNNNDGGWSDLEGNGTTVCWLEIPKGETWNMELNVSAADVSKVAHIMLMVACWDKDGTQADGVTPRPEPPYTGTVTIGTLTLTAEETQPSVPGTTIEGTPDAAWRYDKGGENPYTFTDTEGTYTISYNAPIGWNYNIASDYVFTPAENAVVCIPVTNKNEVAINVRFDLMTSDAGGVWVTLLQGTETTVGAGESIVIEMTVSAGAEIKGILAFLDVNNATQSGSIEIAPVTMKTAGSQTAVTEKDITSELTFVKAADSDPTTIENNKITWTDFDLTDPNGNWNGGFKANYTLEAGYTKIVLTFKNTSDHAIRVQASARNIAWNPEYGSTGLVIAAGETASITITLSDTEAADVGIISFYCDLWANWSDDYDQRPQDGQGNYLETVNGSMEIVSVKVC